jgi:spermidine/putrescine transport system permease protein
MKEKRLPFFVNLLKPTKIKGEATRHAKRALSRRTNQKKITFSRVVFVFTLIFLFLPLLVLIFYSFNSNKDATFTSFSVKWYEQLFLNSRSLWTAFRNSIVIALSSAATATIVGALGAIGVNWYRFKLRGYVQAMSFLPMVLPEIIIGVSLALFFSAIKLNLGIPTIYIAHVTFELPFTFMMVMSRLDEFDYTIIEAAHDLGANEQQTLFKVTVPMCLPGIVSGFVTAVTFSLEDFVITFFVSGPGSTTLPIYIWNTIRVGVSPVINALSVVVIAAIVILTFLVRNFLKYVAH